MLYITGLGTHRHCGLEKLQPSLKYASSNTIRYLIQRLVLKPGTSHYYVVTIGSTTFVCFRGHLSKSVTPEWFSIIGVYGLLRGMADKRNR